MCKVCKIGGEEENFFIHCQINSNIRNPRINAIKPNIIVFTSLIQTLNFKFILDSNKNVLSSFGQLSSCIIFIIFILFY